MKIMKFICYIVQSNKKNIMLKYEENNTPQHTLTTFGQGCHV
jgi:hypothetical protein